MNPFAADASAGSSGAESDFDRVFSHPAVDATTDDGLSMLTGKLGIKVKTLPPQS